MTDFTADDFAGEAQIFEEVVAEQAATGIYDGAGFWSVVARRAQMFRQAEAMARAAQAQAWQPIETAPKDRQIMLWDGEYVTQGAWCSHGAGYWLPAEANDFSGPGWMPKHWSPMPAPPKETQKE